MQFEHPDNVEDGVQLIGKKRGDYSKVRVTKFRHLRILWFLHFKLP